MRRVVISLFTAVVLVIVFLVLCTFVRRPYERILLDRFGHIIDQDQQARIMYNWYFKLPTDNVIRIDTRLHMYTTPLQEVVTAGSEPIAVSTYAAWRITDPFKFYKTTSGNDTRATAIMSQKLSGLVQSKLANHKIDEIFNTDESKLHTAEIERQVAEEATKGVAGGASAGIQDQGLEIVQIGFSRIAFPPNNANAIYNRMASERMKQASLYKSQGESDAARTRAEGEAEASNLRSQAQVQAGQTRGDGDRKALEILAGVQQSPAARDFYEYWKSMEFVKSSLAKNTYLVLPTDADWLKSLFSAPTSAPQGPATQPTVGQASPGPGQWNAVAK